MLGNRVQFLGKGFAALLIGVGLLSVTSTWGWADEGRPPVLEGDESAFVETPLVEAAPKMEISPREPWNEMGPPSEEQAELGDVAGVEGVDRISILVHFDPFQDRPNRPEVKRFASRRGAFTKYEYEILPNVINIRNFPREAVEALSKLPGVTKVEEDYEVSTFHNDSVALIRGQQPQITGAGISANGSGVRVCVIDSGIDSNSIMYSTRIDAAAGWDFVNNDSNPEDDNGHGSHVAGTVLGGFVNADFACATTGPESMQGVAPAATLIGVKVLNSGGSGSASNIIAGINRCASTTLPGGQADVINMSLGGGQYTSTCDSDTMAIAVNNAVNAGVTVVCAAGNNGFSNSLSAPACASGAIAVAATYDENYPNCDFPSQTSFQFCLDSFCLSTCTDNNPVVDQRVCFSNRSTKIDVAAPGCIIFSDDSTVAAGNGLVGFCGTSQASPHVAGLAALLLDLDPTLTPADIRQLIRDGAIDKGAAGFDTSYGYGRIDVINSLQLADPGCSGDPECSDGQFCNGTETCVGGSCQAGSDPCLPQLCRESDDQCVDCLDAGDCDDGLFCNGAESCDGSGTCQAGSDPCSGLPCDEGTDSCVGGAEVWMSFIDSATVPGVGTAADEDIVARNVSSGAWSLIFDGSDVGLSGFTIDGMARLSDGSILLSFTAAGTVGGVAMDDSDILRFVPTSLGSTTAGAFSMYFDGSDVGLTTTAEDVDAISVTSSGQLVLSTEGSFSVTGVSGTDADLIVFTPTSLGSTTAGTYAMYFDGSDVGLSTTNEDVDAAGLTPSGTILLSTLGSAAVPGVSAADEDVMQFTPTSLGSNTAGSYTLYLDLSALGISTGEDVGSVEYKP